MGNDKRRVKRISVDLPVTVCLFNNRANNRLSGPITGSVKNFSPVGAALLVATILLDGQHLFYACHDNPDYVLELEFALGESPEEIITVPAFPVWFDRDQTSGTNHFVVGLKFLAGPKSPEIKILSREACKDEKRLVSLWKKMF